MADPNPGPQETANRKLPTARPAVSEENATWMNVAKQLIEENRRATSRWRALWDSVKRLLARRSGSASSDGDVQGHSGSSSPAGGPSPARGPSPAGGGAPAAPGPADSLAKQIRELSKEEAEKATAYVLDRITRSSRTQKAHEEGRLPGFEMLLDKTDPNKHAKERWSRGAVSPQDSVGNAPDGDNRIGTRPVKSAHNMTASGPYQDADFEAAMVRAQNSPDATDRAATPTSSTAAVDPSGGVAWLDDLSQRAATMLEGLEQQSSGQSPNASGVRAQAWGDESPPSQSHLKDRVSVPEPSPFEFGSIDLAQSDESPQTGARLDYYKASANESNAFEVASRDHAQSGGNESPPAAANLNFSRDSAHPVIPLTARTPEPPPIVRSRDTSFHQPVPIPAQLASPALVRAAHNYITNGTGNSNSSDSSSPPPTPGSPELNPLNRPSSPKKRR